MRRKRKSEGETIDPVVEAELAPYKMTRRQVRVKRQLESLLKKHRYVHDDRPDHREWMKHNPAFSMKIRLDQNNPKGWNGFQCTITTFMRWDVTAKHIETLLLFLKKELA